MTILFCLRLDDYPNVLNRYFEHCTYQVPYWGLFLVRQMEAPYSISVKSRWWPLRLANGDLLHKAIWTWTDESRQNSDIFLPTYSSTTLTIYFITYNAIKWFLTQKRKRDLQHVFHWVRSSRDPTTKVTLSAIIKLEIDESYVLFELRLVTKFKVIFIGQVHVARSRDSLESQGHVRSLFAGISQYLLPSWT